ncbi:deoxycytidylate deaminase [bacterium endosymbiont of Bathymodiolus sp. 5 South]|jgi:dCMP deaminase|uniref:deoxycytidylate deaminase n=1 Tax=bacterium endosymbiont of Bathymodiolus sp. 5 South TaxID=1181670 RepID=UPI0010BBC1C2|nr:dCMP deaminase family protein [bacterium endosymbiont of Bathymodiolus sp. 5 South]CAC9455119.1 dCMP deaminase (EC 3.5.4.12) [uncultured Gammaproteobacteria bacterium]CAC9655045.1 dCMP deaminase (EC 3.5.4.12) [uncultured Gammaproteobacteria bacterium]SSC08720.1 dCMP deaminase [bacterium endosymbiont of Bathymodiolus sp. 5 South]VVH59911.1 dCMP deaminase (EC [uncultured Gammaproteobacteria bacterium]VVH61871.1 dCMP deaminase (EC [uncultured Gammaproteobacteria bacterium]
MSVLSKWDERYLALAKEVSTWSKDPSTQVGAVTVGSKKEVLSQGFNGFPRNIKDTDERYNNRETKYKFVVHAEMNAIYNATYSGTSLDGATLYVYGLPICSECAKGIIQVGIKKVVVEKSKELDNWNDSVKLSKAMFDEAGVDLIIK